MFECFSKSAISFIGNIGVLSDKPIATRTNPAIDFH